MTPIRSVVVNAALLFVTAFLTHTPAQAASSEVNLYSSRHYEADKKLYESFTASTGIKVNVVNAAAGQLIERLKSEGANSPADLLFTADVGNLWRAQTAGLFQPVRSPELEAVVPSSFRDAAGHWYGLTKRARVILYSKERVAPGALLSYEDLAAPKWKGRLLIRSSSNVYNQSLVASMIAADGVAATETWARGVVANLARPPRGGDRDQIRGVAAGEADIAVANTYYLAQMLADPNEVDRLAVAGLGVIFPNQNGRGAHVNISGAGVTRHAPHRDNAIKLLEFLVGAQAQRVLAEANFEYPIRAGVDTSATIVGFGAFKEDALDLGAIGENTTEAVKLMDRVGWK